MKVHLVTNHARVLAFYARNQEATVRQCAVACGITERTVIKESQELRAEGWLTIRRVGRRSFRRLNEGARRLLPAIEALAATELPI